VTLVDLTTLAAAGALGVLVLAPQRRVDTILREEETAVHDLRALEARLVEHRNAVGRDSDGDGVGEYASLTEVLGRDPGDAARVGTSDVWRLHGYYFASLVPGPQRTPVLAGSPSAVADFAELAYALLAWPAQPGVTGMVAYMASPQGLYRHQIDGYPYDLEPPAPEWTMVVRDAEGVRRTGPYPEKDWLVPVLLPEQRQPRERRPARGR